MRWGWPLLGALVACSSPGELLVDVRSNFTPSTDFDRVRVEVRTGPSGAAGTTIVGTTASNAAPTDNYASGHRVAVFSDLEAGTFFVAASLELDGTSVAMSERMVTVDGATGVTFELNRDCAGACPDAGLDSGLDTGLDAGAEGGADGGADGGVDAGPRPDWNVRGGVSTFCAFRTGEPGLYCWGGRGDSSAGTGEAEFVLTPTNIAPTDEPIRDVDTDNEFGCAVIGDGDVWCWGRNNTGQLGDGTMEDRGVPGRALLSNAVEVSVSLQFACARLLDGTVSCWGQNNVGQLGRGMYSDSEPMPALVPGVDGVTQITTSGAATFALSEGRIRAWGNSSELGHVSAEHRSPSAIPDLAGVAEVRGGLSHVCARLSAGGVTCWGENRFGQLGIDSVDAVRTPVMTFGLTDLRQLVVSGDTNWVLEPTGRVIGWGRNSLGGLVTGDREDQLVPTLPAFASSGFVEIASVGNATCGVKAGDGVYCWGVNFGGAFGNGAMGSLASPPVRVDTLPD